MAELYFNDAGELVRWSAEIGVWPAGETWEGLRMDLCKMLVDALAWEPVRFEDLHVGMRFVPLVSLDQRKEIADMLETSSGIFAQMRTLKKQ
ncbi:MAG: hypothetical protein U1E51_06645 [Candidatus Binatia bacterium]|nr:hypothetical protein [Candidatus Binatia bacterium]